MDLALIFVEYLFWMKKKKKKTFSLFHEKGDHKPDHLFGREHRATAASPEDTVRAPSVLHVRFMIGLRYVID